MYIVYTVHTFVVRVLPLAWFNHLSQNTSDVIQDDLSGLFIAGISNWHSNQIETVRWCATRSGVPQLGAERRDAQRRAATHYALRGMNLFMNPNIFRDMCGFYAVANFIAFSYVHFAALFHRCALVYAEVAAKCAASFAW